MEGEIFYCPRCMFFGNKTKLDPYMDGKPFGHFFCDRCYTTGDWNEVIKKPGFFQATRNFIRNYWNNIKIYWKNKKMKEIYIKLYEDDFRCLVSGGLLTLKNNNQDVIIMLADIGFNRMDKAIKDAASGKLEHYSNLTRDI